MITPPNQHIYAHFKSEPEMIELKLNGRPVGLVILERDLIPMFPAYCITPNLLIYKEMKVHEILDFHLVPTKAMCQRFQELIQQ